MIYALHAFSAFTAFLSSALVLTASLTGWPSIIAVVLTAARDAGGHLRMDTKPPFCADQVGSVARKQARLCRIAAFLLIMPP